MSLWLTLLLSIGCPVFYTGAAGFVGAEAMRRLVADDNGDATFFAFVLGLGWPITLPVQTGIALSRRLAATKLPIARVL